MPEQAGTDPEHTGGAEPGERVGAQSGGSITSCGDRSGEV
jgi:hypothetical protein